MAVGFESGGFRGGKGAMKPIIIGICFLVILAILVWRPGYYEHVTIYQDGRKIGEFDGVHPEHKGADLFLYSRFEDPRRLVGAFDRANHVVILIGPEQK
jgi:hypothetical protein